MSSINKNKSLLSEQQNKTPLLDVLDNITIEPIDESPNIAEIEAIQSAIEENDELIDDIETAAGEANDGRRFVAVDVSRLGSETIATSFFATNAFYFEFKSQELIDDTRSQQYNLANNVETIIVDSLATAFIEDSTSTNDDVVSFTTSDEDGDTITVSLSDADSVNYAIDEDNNTVVLTDAGAALVNSGSDLPSFTLVANNSEQTTAVTVNPPVTTDVNDAATITISAVTQFTEDDTNANDVVVTFSLNDKDGDAVTVSLSDADSVNYAIDEDNNTVVLTEAGVALVNSGSDLPSFTLEANDGEQSTTVVANPAATTDVNDAATITIGDITQFTEDSTNTNDVVVTFTTSDEDGDAVMVSLSDADSVNYAIDEDNNTVVLTEAGVALVNSGSDLPSFTLEANDGEQTTTIAVNPVATTDVNDAPTLVIGDITQFTEDLTSANDVVLTYTTSDEDGDAVTVSLSDADSVNYAIDEDNNTIVLTEAGAALVNSGSDLPSFTLEANDGEQSTTITVNPAATMDINDAATITIGDVTQFTEDSTNTNDVVVTFTTSDEGGDAVTVSLSDTSNYVLVDNTVVLTQVGADIVNRGEDLPGFMLSATDDIQATPAIVTVNPATTTDVNDAATIMVTAADNAVTEDDTNNTTASGTVSVEDDDTGQSSLSSSTDTTASYGSVLVNGNDWTYTLDNTNATVNALVAGDTLVDTITFTSTDGTTQTQEIVITGSNDAATITITATDSAVTEDDTNNITASGTVNVEDDDTGQSSLLSSTATYGNVTVDGDGNWTYALDNSNDAVNALAYSATLADTITFTSADGTTQTQEIVITGANKAPTGITLTNTSVNENDAGAIIGTLATVDVDVGDSHTYSVNDERFEVINSELKLKTGESLDHESAESVIVTVTSTDSGGLTTEQTFTLTVGDVNNAPEITNNTASVTVDENTTVVGNYAATDADSDTVTYTLTGTNAALFSIASNGDLSFVAAPDAESNVGPFLVNVVATDDGEGTLFDTQAVSVSVNDVNEAPNAIDDTGFNFSPGGLQGSYYAYQEGQDGGNLDDLNVVRNFIENNSADAHFIASNLNYGQVNDGLGRNENSVSNLKTFLKADEATLSSIPAGSSDGILHFRGRIDLAAGDYNFRVNADDGYTILIDGVDVATVFQKQDVTLTTHNLFTVANGSNGSLHDIEIIYWDQGITAVFEVALSNNNGVDYYNLNSTNYTISRSDGYSAYKGENFTVDTATLLANDTDAENATLTVVGVGNASDGASVSLVNGIVTLTPTTGFSGSVTFEYTVTDGNDTDTATVTVEYFNEFSAEDDLDIVTVGNEITGNVISGEGGDGTGKDNLLFSNGTVSSVDFNGSNYTADTNGDITIEGNHGTLDISSDGTYSYQANATGSVTFGDVVTGVGAWTQNKNSWDKTELYGFTGGTSFDTDDNGTKKLAINNANVSNDDNIPKFQYTGPGDVGTLGVNESGDDETEYYVIDQRNNNGSNNREALAVKLPGGTNSVDVSFDYIEGNDQVTWIVYDENLQQVGAGSTTDGDNSLTVTVTSEFSYILFTTAGDDDYGINSITYTPTYIEDVFTYTLTNTEGNSDTATLTITHTKEGTLIADTLKGSNNNDVINGLGGADFILGNGGDDIINGGSGADNINGGTGDDTITGGADGDTIVGNAGSDMIMGGAGIDNISGGDGDDTIIGGTGDDILIGGSGIDTFIWKNNDSGIDHIEDFTIGVDVIDMSDILQISNGDNLNNFLDFESDGTHTTISIYAEGNSNSTVTQTIVLDNVDLGSNDVTIINDMLTGTTNGGSLFVGDSSLVDTLVIQAIADETN